MSLKKLDQKKSKKMLFFLFQAIASSYMHEHENPPDNIPEDSIFIRHVSDQETKPK